MAVYRHYPYVQTTKQRLPPLLGVAPPPASTPSHEYLAEIYARSVRVPALVASYITRNNQRWSWNGPRQRVWLEPAPNPPLRSGQELVASLQMVWQLARIAGRRDYVWQSWLVPRQNQQTAIQGYTQVPKANQDLLVANILLARAAFLGSYSKRYRRPHLIYPRKKMPGYMTQPEQERSIWTKIFDESAITTNWTDITEPIE